MAGPLRISQNAFQDQLLPLSFYIFIVVKPSPASTGKKPLTRGFAGVPGFFNPIIKGKSADSPFSADRTYLLSPNKDFIEDFTFIGW